MNVHEYTQFQQYYLQYEISKRRPQEVHKNKPIIYKIYTLVDASHRTITAISLQHSMKHTSLYFYAALLKSYRYCKYQPAHDLFSVACFTELKGVPNNGQLRTPKSQR